MSSISARHIVEETVAQYLSSLTELAGVTVYTGDSSKNMALPRVIVLCDSARPPNGLPEGLGNYDCSMRLTVVTSADDPEGEDTALDIHRARCAAIQGYMGDISSIKTVFAGGGDAVCYDVTPVSEDEGVTERNWASVLSYSVWLVVDPA